MTTFWLSTPRFTLTLDVDTAGIIVRCAPYLRRTWTGKPWRTLHGWLTQRYGAALRVEVLA